MTYKFFFLYGWLNLFSFSPKKGEEINEGTRLVETKALEIFEYGKNNDGYWDEAKLYNQVVTKALLIVQALYPRYSPLFLFDNTTSHSVNFKDILYVKGINKSPRGKQPVLQKG